MVTRLDLEEREFPIIMSLLIQRASKIDGVLGVQG